MAAESSEADGQIINICSGDPVSIRDLVRTLRQLIPGSSEPVYLPPRSGDIYQSYGDPNLAKKLLSFRVKTSLSDGLAKTLEWMRS